MFGSILSYEPEGQLIPAKDVESEGQNDLFQSQIPAIICGVRGKPFSEIAICFPLRNTSRGFLIVSSIRRVFFIGKFK